MAEANNKNQVSDSFADDLDAMLNDTESLMNNDDSSMDDEDAIDRLLMDEGFNLPEAEVANVADDIDKMLEQDFAESDDNNTPDKLDVDQLIDTIEEDANDEFAEIDEFSAEDDNTVLMGDFDIASEDSPDNSSAMGAVDKKLDEFEEDDFINTERSQFTGSSAQSASVHDDLTEVIQGRSSVEPNNAALADALAQIKENKSAIAGMNSQLAQLRVANENLKQQLELSIKADKSQALEQTLNELKQEQKKLVKTTKENEAKTPVLVYVALGIAIVALLLAGGFGAMGLGTQSGINELTELASTLEEEVDVLVAKDSSGQLKQLSESIDLVNAQHKMLDTQVSELETQLQNGTLQATVTDLVAQNEHTQQTLEQLLTKVDELEKRKLASSRRTKSKTAVTKKARPLWAVNLVSLKQEWYAKQKAAEYEKKGVPTQIVPIKLDGADWFRLTVSGFKTEYEAAAYAVKVKKMLNLTSVWVIKP